MTVRKSVGITILGWLMIILASLQLTAVSAPLGSLSSYRLFSNGSFAQTISIFFLVFLGVEIILGINIVRYKEWARKGVFVFVAVSILITAAMSLNVRKNYWDYVSESWHELMSWRIKFETDFLRKNRVYADRLRKAASDERAAIISAYEKEKKEYFVQVVSLNFFRILGILVLLLRFLLWYIVAVVYLILPAVKIQFH